MKTPDYLIIQSIDIQPEEKEYSIAELIGKQVCPTSKGGFGWVRPGIDYLIPLDGTLQTILPEEFPNEADFWGISEGPQGLLGLSKHIAYVKLPKDPQNPSPVLTPEEIAQQNTLIAVIEFYIRRFPKIRILGFDEAPNKIGSDNPGFKVGNWLRQTVKIPEENIYLESKNRL